MKRIIENLVCCWYSVTTWVSFLVHFIGGKKFRLVDEAGKNVDMHLSRAQTVSTRPRDHEEFLDLSQNFTYYFFMFLLIILCEICCAITFQSLTFSHKSLTL